MNISCNKCKEEKDSSHFHKNKRKKNGFEYTCKVCVKKRLEEIKIENNIQTKNKQRKHKN